MADIICYKSDGQILDYYTQWDVGQQLMIKGVDLSSAPYFYFTNSISDTAYVMPSEVVDNSILVSIPDILLHDAVPLIVYISYNQDIDIGTTEYAVRIPVMPRVKPNDYVYNPESGGSGGTPGGSVSIANNLTTNDSTVALSAAQGVVLKALVDTLDKEKVDTDSISNAISDALDDAIANGEITGIQGEPGKDGKPGADGRDGRGIENVTRTSGNGSPGTTDIYTITYSDDTTSTFSVYNGADGKDGMSGSGTGNGESGEDGATFTPYVDSKGNLSWTNDKGLENPETVNIMGEDGVSCTHSWNGTTLTVESASGTSSADLKGADGADGIGITSVKQTVKSSNDNGDNIVTIFLSDGTSSTITIQNGSKGSPGAIGETGIGITGIEQTAISDADNGINTYTINLSDGNIFSFDVKNGSKGSPGATGETGATGIGVEEVVQTAISAEDGGENIFSIKLSNGESYAFSVKNGSRGSTGSTGAAGEDATINGVNTLTIQAGGGISISHSENTMTIGATYSYGTADLTAGSSSLTTGSLYFVYE